MLLELLEPGTPLADHAGREEALDIACSLLRRLWVPATAGHPFRLVTALAEQYAATFPKQYIDAGEPFAGSLIECAVDLCRQFARN